MRNIVTILSLLLATSAAAATPDLAALVSRHEAATVADRCWLHQHPELSDRESATRAYLLERLREIPGVTVVDGAWGQGLVAVLAGAKDGPVIAWRADMDGLPITEHVTCRSPRRGAIPSAAATSA